MSKCQRCRLPIVTHDSLTELSKGQIDLLTNSKSAISKHQNDQPIASSQDLSLNQLKSSIPIHSKLFTSESSHSFVILSDSSEQEDNNHTISNTVNQGDKIWSLLNNEVVDFPVCSECSTALIESLKEEFERCESEKNVYFKFLNKLKSQKGPIFTKTEGSLKELEKLKVLEKDSLEELKQLESEKRQLELELEEIEDEYEGLNVKMNDFYSTKNQIELEVQEFVNERNKIQSLYEYNLNQLDKLRKTNVYNDTFNISHDNQFGTINGLRLGSLDSCRVSWHEINAALGQVILLLSTLTTKLNLKLDGYKLKPMGSTSQIEKIEKADTGAYKTTIFEVYSKGDFMLERIFLGNKLDAAMIALLDIVKQIGVKLKEKGDQSIDFPYPIENDKIGGTSIKLSSKTVDENWTTACKFLLTNMKWVVAYASMRSRSKSKD